MKTAVGICFRNLLLVRFLLLAAVFFFAVDGWASCPGSSSFPARLLLEGRYDTREECESHLNDCPLIWSNGSGCYAKFGSSYCGLGSSTGWRYGVNCEYPYGNVVSECEAKRITCEAAGKWFDSDNCTCADICGTLESKCTRAGGRFTGRALNLGEGQACCSAICDQCNTEANEKIVELKKKYCCEAGFAPPAEGDNCYSPPGISGCGMTTLQRMTSTLDYQCRDPNSSEEAANAYYDQCFPGSSSSGEGGSSSSGEGGSSSSGEGGSSSGGSNYPEGCDECPWLDSILDTLTLLKWNSDDMLQCIVNPSVCSTSPEETEVSQIDTVIFEGIKERLDSVVAGLHINDTSILKLLDSLGKSMRMDSLKMRLDSVLAVASLKNDTSTRRVIAAFESSVDENLSKLRQVTDTNFVKLRNGVFELDTGMKHHLDSIVAHLPDTILDSIRKYQDSTLDRIDTALFGAGVGFSLVDSMIDTVVKYFKVFNHYDSVYNSMFASFDSTFKYKMENLEMSIENDYSALGYGDTATSTLRSDLSDFKNSVSDGFSLVDSVIDTLVKYFKVSNYYDSVYNSMFASFDSTFKYKMENLELSIENDYSALGYGDTATSTLRSDLSDFKNSVSDGFEFLKSSLGYGDTATSTLRSDLSDFKNSVLGAIASFDSSVSSEISDLLGVFSPGAVDSGAVGYGSGFIADGERYSDSLARAIGWLGGLDGVNVDSVFSHSTWETSGVDSVNDFVNDTLGDILDSLHLRLKSENDSIKGSLPDSLTVWADSLIKVSPFVSFDSLIYSTIGARIPNSDQCPEDCQSWSLSLPRFGLINYTVDFGLCLGRVPLGGLNVLGFLRLIIRLVIVWSCISIVMWTFSHRKM